MDRNTILAILLSFIFVFIVLTVLGPKAPKESDTREGTSEVNKSKRLERSTKESKEELEGEERIKLEGEKSKGVDKDEKLSGLSKEESYLKDYVGKMVIPSKENNLAEVGLSKATDFLVENEVYKIQFTSLDGAIGSVKLKNYKDNGDKLIETVFDVREEEVFPFATSFVGARGLNAKLKSVYDYGIYSYKAEGKKLSIQDKGTLNDYTKYFDVIKSNLGRVLLEGESKDRNYQIVLFASKYNVLEAKGGEGISSRDIEIIKTYIISDRDYVFGLDFRVINLSNEAIVVGNNESKEKNASIRVHWGESLGPYYSEEKKSSYDLQIQSAYLKEYDDFSTEEEIVEKGFEGFRNFKWVSLDSRYLIVSIIPEWSVKERAGGEKAMRWDKGSYFGEIYNGEFKKSTSFLFWESDVKVKENKEVIGVGFEKIYLEGGGYKDYHLKVFVGPKTRSLLTAEEYDKYDLIKVRDRSWVPFIKPLEWGIEWFLFSSYKYVVSNFGVSIVLLTIVLKILLHPLTKKSLTATQKMSQLQPKLKELEKKHKNDKQKQQKELMALYKKEGINPLGGCLPMLLQLPVFFALWSVVPHLLELKNSKFLWINDLSSPDTVANVPLILTNDLNILPIIMTLTSVVQMKFMPQATPGMGMGGDSKGQTAKMMQYMMPVLFLFIFWSMPSGLVLYWTVQNLLQIGQQLYTNMRAKAKSR